MELALEVMEAKVRFHTWREVKRLKVMMMKMKVTIRREQR